MMALYQRGRWKITLADLERGFEENLDKEADWLETIASALSAGKSEVEALDKSLEELDDVILAAATIHTIYGIEEGLTLSDALKSFGVGADLVLMDFIELGLASGRLDVVLRQAASYTRTASQRGMTIPDKSPISCVEEWLVFYSLAVMLDAGRSTLQALGLMKDKFNRSNPRQRRMLWAVTRMYLLLIREGYIVSEALEATEFSSAIVQAAREAERTGDLEVAFARWTGYVPTQYAVR